MAEVLFFFALAYGIYGSMIEIVGLISIFTGKGAHRASSGEMFGIAFPTAFLFTASVVAKFLEI